MFVCVKPVNEERGLGSRLKRIPTSGMVLMPAGAHVTSPSEGRCRPQSLFNGTASHNQPTSSHHSRFGLVGRPKARATVSN